MAVLDAKKAYKNLKKKGFVDSITKTPDHNHIPQYTHKTLKIKHLIIKNQLP